MVLEEMTDSMEYWDKESIRCAWNIFCTEKYSKNDRDMLKGQIGQLEGAQISQKWDNLNIKLNLIYKYTHIYIYIHMNYTH